MNKPAAKNIINVFLITAYFNFTYIRLFSYHQFSVVLPFSYIDIDAHKTCGQFSAFFTA